MLFLLAGLALYGFSSGMVYGLSPPSFRAIMRLWGNTPTKPSGPNTAKFRPAESSNLPHICVCLFVCVLLYSSRLVCNCAVRACTYCVLGATTGAYWYCQPMSCLRSTLGISCPACCQMPSPTQPSSRNLDLCGTLSTTPATLVSSCNLALSNR